MQSNVRENVVEDGEVDFLRLLGILFDNRWIIAGSTLLFFLLSVAYVIVAKPVYQADAMVQVQPKDSGLASLSSDISSMLSDSNALAITEIDIIESQRVVGAAVDALNLTVDVSQGGGFFARHFSDYNYGDVVVSQFSVADNLLPDEYGGVMNWLRGHKIRYSLDLEVGQVPGEYSLFHKGELVGKGTVGTPFKSADGGVSLNVTRLHAKPGDHFNITQIPRGYAISSLLAQLDVQENGKNSGVIQLSMRGSSPDLTLGALRNITDAYVQQNIQMRAEEAKKGADFLRDQLPRVKKDLYKSEADLNTYRLQHGSLDMDLEARAALERGASLDLQMGDLQVQQAQMSQQYAPGHPAYKALMDERESVRRQQEALKSQIANMPESQQVMLRLSRDVEVNEQLYMQMFNKIQELDVERAGTVGNVRVVDDPQLEVDPVRPLRLLLVCVGIIIGFVTGLFVAFVRTAINVGLESVEDLEEIGVDVLAVLPLSDAQGRAERNLEQAERRGQRGVLRLLTFDEPEDIAVEALRSLRTSLYFSLQSARNNVVMVSGPSPNVGKTFVSTNLGAVIVQSGQRVLVIDADLRRGSMHRLCGVAPHGGLSEYLQGTLTIEAAIKSGGVPGFDLMTRGAAPGNPAELILGSRFAELIEWASKSYDVVLIDTPPVLAVTDAAVIGRYAGTALLVVRHRVNPAREVKLTMKRFEQNGVHINGCILNALHQKGGGYRFNYGYYAYNYRSDEK